MIAARLMMSSVAVLSATAVQAECRLDSFVVSDGEIVARYDPFDAAANPTPISLRSSGNAECADQNVRVTLDSDPSTPLAVNGTIRLESDGASLEGVITDGSGRAPSGLFSRGGPSALLRLGSQGDVRDGDLRLVLEPGQTVPPGIYRARINVIAQPLLEDGTEGSETRSAFDISVAVLPAVGLAAGSGTSLDLGTIRSGGTANSDVSFRAYANTGYELHFRSDHDFALALNGDSGTPTIAYVPMLGGQPFTPGENGISFADPGASGFRQHLLNVQVPRLERRPAGTYRDYITVEIRATVSG